MNVILLNYFNKTTLCDHINPQLHAQELSVCLSRSDFGDYNVDLGMNLLERGFRSFDVLPF